MSITENSSEIAGLAVGFSAMLAFASAGHVFAFTSGRWSCVSLG